MVGTLLEMCRDTALETCSLSPTNEWSLWGVYYTQQIQDSPQQDMGPTSYTAGSSFHPLKMEWREFNSIILFHFHRDMGDKRHRFTL